MRRLEQEVGEGDLVGQVTFDQPYAVVMHEGGWENFMGRFGPKEIEHYHRGGGAKFLENALKEKYQRYYNSLANSALNGTLGKTMIEVAEDLAGDSARRAPIEEGTLRASASPEVTSNGVSIYHRPGAPRERR